ncbi:MAG: nuclease-related domain-containing protein [Ferrimonas sp.]
MTTIFIFLAAAIGFFLGYKKKNKATNVSKPNLENKVKDRFPKETQKKSQEHLVVECLKAQIDSEKEILLNNLTLPLKDGTTTQIDHVLISKRGIFVIESKDYNAWIFGQEKDTHWTASYPNKKQYSFQNPLRQNYKHTQAIENILDFVPKEQVHSLIVFSGKTTFKTDMPDNVIYLKDLPDYLKKYQAEPISLEQVHLGLGRLSFVRLPETAETDEAHIKQLNLKHQNS